MKIMKAKAAQVFPYNMNIHESDLQRYFMYYSGGWIATNNI